MMSPYPMNTAREMRDMTNVIESKDQQVTLHRFEQLGLGKGPFKVVGMVSIPSPSLAEQNPSAYNAALRNLPQGIGVGTCAACGTPIMHNFIVKSADNQTHCIGSECIKKVHDATLTTQAKEIVRKQKQEAKRELQRARAEEAYARREAELDKERAANGGMTNWEINKKKEDEILAHKLEKLAPLAAALKDGKRGFRDSVARDLMNGHVPQGRGLDIMIDILSKQAGRSGSLAYKQRQEEIEQLLAGLE